jgi:hypothetical protein
MAKRKGGGKARKIPAGSKFKSARQMRFMFARVPSAAKKWEDGKTTRKSDWAGARGGARKLRTGRRKRR